MKYGKLSQEWLKCIACLSMLADHIGAVFFPQVMILRVIGRVAFPIYCFLLAEGVYYTKNPVRYGIRLAVGVLLAEIPFDFALYGGFTWQHQSVMVTLFLSFLAAVSMQAMGTGLLRGAVLLPFALAAEWLRCDYGGFGVILVGVFVLTRDLPGKNVVQSVFLLLIFWTMNSMRLPLLGLSVPIELFAILALVPICLYSREKRCHSKWLQAGFYLFYPLHLAAIWLIA